MKKTQKLLSLALALILVLGLSSPVFASNPVNKDQVQGSLEGLVSKDKPQNTTLHVHKLVAKKYNEGLPVEANGGVLSPQQLALLGTDVEEVDGVTFTYYKLQNAAQLDKFLANPENYATKQAVEAESLVPAGTVETTGGQGATVSLEDGYYWFIETNRPANLTSMLAVPFGISIPVVNSVQGTTPQGEVVAANQGYLTTVHVYPKNVKEEPQVTKDNDKANSLEYSNYLGAKHEAQNRIGGVENFTIKTRVPANANYKYMNWSDIMTQGLSFDQGSLKIGKATIDPANGKVTGLDVSFLEVADFEVTSSPNGFVIKLNESGLEKVKAQAALGSFDLAIQYSATVNSAAVVDRPDENFVTFNYGNDPHQESGEVTPQNKEIKVEKTWAEGPAPSGVSVTYFLIDTTTGRVVDSVTKQAPDLSHTFTDLDDSRTYKVKEVVNGYRPEYQVSGNTVTVKNHKEPTSITPTPPKVTTDEHKFVKTDGMGTRLEGAQFVVKNGQGQYLAVKDAQRQDADYQAYVQAQAAYLKAIEDYNQAQEADKPSKLADIESTKAKRDEAFAKAHVEYEFVADKNSPNVVKLVSNAQGQFIVKGLETDGVYYLEELVAPAGFAKLNGDIEFKVGTPTTPIDYELNSGLKDAQEVKNKKITIPPTGGIGTGIFVVSGITLMFAAVVLFKRRQREI